MVIVNLFAELARKQKKINAFYYGGQRGAGNSVYPLTWLDDPISGRSASATAIAYTVNVDILGKPKTEAEIPAVQAEAFTVGLSYLEYIKNNITGVTVESFNFISLREYYDDDAAGFRFTFQIVQANPINLCLEYFDEEKQFTNVNTLPDFLVNNPTGCAVFTDSTALPNFEI